MSTNRTYRWNIADPSSHDSNGDGESHMLVKRLADELTISPVLAQILVLRGIDTRDKARAFFRPDLSDLHDPMIMQRRGSHGIIAKSAAQIKHGHAGDKLQGSKQLPVIQQVETADPAEVGMSSSCTLSILHRTIYLNIHKKRC